MFVFVFCCFFLCMQLDIIEATHSHGVPKVLWNVIGKQCHWKNLGDSLDNLFKVRHRWKLRTEFVIFAGSCQTCPGMSKVLRKIKKQYLRKEMSGWLDFFCKQSNINQSYQLNMSLWVRSGMSENAKRFPKLQITNVWMIVIVFCIISI